MSNISVFRREFRGDIVTPADPDYKKAISRWATTAEREAKVVAFVRDAVDVAHAIKYARANNLPIAIRSGGHSPGGASSTRGGLVIDLSRHIADVRVDAEKRVAHVGAGALWQTVDEKAIEHGLATVGGTVNHTGVGGLILGGGFGWLCGSHGLAIDNLVQATVVTADGTILTASDTENPDLFFGLRGGGCNFGVVTEFVLKLHPQRRTVYAGTVVFRPDALEKIIEVTRAWWPNISEREAMFQMSTIGPDGKPIVVLVLFYNGTEAEGRANFKVLFDIGPVVDTTGEIPYEVLNSLLNPMVEHGRCVYLKGVAQKQPDYPSIAKAFEKVVDCAKTSCFKPIVIYEYFSFGKISSVPREQTAFRRDLYSSVVTALLWTDNTQENRDRARILNHEIIEIISQGQPELHGGESLGYSNYDQEAGEPDGALDKAKLVFGENYARLQQIKKQYDPENIFNKWFPITPA